MKFIPSNPCRLVLLKAKVAAHEIINQSILLFQASIAHVCTKHKKKRKYTDGYKNIHKLFVQQTKTKICKAKKTKQFVNQFITGNHEMNGFSQWVWRQ